GRLIPLTGNPLETYLTLDDVIAALGTLTGQPEYEKYGQAVDAIGKKLRPFYGDGIYASFFKNTAISRSDEVADLFVYDLDALSGDSILQTLVTMSVI